MNPLDEPQSAPPVREPQPTAMNYLLAAVGALAFIGIAFLIIAKVL